VSRSQFVPIFIDFTHAVKIAWLCCKDIFNTACKLRSYYIYGKSFFVNFWWTL